MMRLSDSEWWRKKVWILPHSLASIQAPPHLLLSLAYKSRPIWENYLEPSGDALYFLVWLSGRTGTSNWISSLPVHLSSTTKQHVNFGNIYTTRSSWPWNITTGTTNMLGISLCLTQLQLLPMAVPSLLNHCSTYIRPQNNVLYWRRIRRQNIQVWIHQINVYISLLIF